MADIIKEIEILNTDDNRLNEIAIKVVLKNAGISKITLFSIVPAISDDVELEEKNDPFQEESKLHYQGLCQEMTLLIDQVLLVTNEEYRLKIIGIYEKILTNYSNKLSHLYRSFLFNRKLFSKQMLYIQSEHNQMKFVINNMNDAELAFTMWIKPLAETDPQRMLYEGKLYQLRELQKAGEVGNYISLIDPESFYSKIYVLKFKRRLLSTKIYDIGFDYTYKVDDSDRHNRGNISTSINITPQPLVLSLFAAFFSLFGTIIRKGMEGGSVERFNNLENYKCAIIGHGLESAIIAVLFFNIYEFTDLGKRLKIGITWRTALVFGVFSGLLGNRLIKALEVFLGFSS